MSTATDKLTEMFDNSRLQCEAIDDSTAQIEAQIEELESQRDAIQEALFDGIAFDMSSYLELKMIDLGGTYILYGSDFGVMNVTDWEIHKVEANPDPPPDTIDTVIYVYEGVGWDNDQTIIDLETDFQFGYDYIHHENGLTGTYGLQDQIDQLYSALDLLGANKDKYGDSRNVFQNHMT